MNYENTHHWLNYIDGEWVDGERRLNVANPASNETFATVALANADDAERALASAVRCVESGALTSPRPAERVRLLLRIAAEIREVSERGMTLLFISHDLPVLAGLSDRMLVMRDGRQVELGATAQILSSPREDYTARLVAASRALDDLLQAGRFENVAGFRDETVDGLRGLALLEREELLRVGVRGGGGHEELRGWGCGGASNARCLYFQSTKTIQMINAGKRDLCGKNAETLCYRTNGRPSPTNG